MPKPAKLRIGSANDLLEGHVLYLSRDGQWTPDLRNAAASTDPDELAALAEAASAQRQVVDVDLVEATPDKDGVPRPVALREVIRDRGPTIRTDLGRQADPEIQQAQARHV